MSFDNDAGGAKLAGQFGDLLQNVVYVWIVEHFLLSSVFIAIDLRVQVPAVREKLNDDRVSKDLVRLGMDIGNRLGR